MWLALEVDGARQRLLAACAPRLRESASGMDFGDGTDSNVLLMSQFIMDIYVVNCFSKESEITCLLLTEPCTMLGDDGLVETAPQHGKEVLITSLPRSMAYQTGSTLISVDGFGEPHLTFLDMTLG